MASLGNFKLFVNPDCIGDKIKLPESVSERVLQLANVTYPLTFELAGAFSQNTATHLISEIAISPICL